MHFKISNSSIKRGKIAFVLGLTASLFFACQSSEEDEKVDKQASEAYDLKIVDSLRVDYLGYLSLLDINNRGQYLLNDPQRGAYLVANENGEILEQFILNPDSKDFSSRPYHGPAFFRDSLLVFNTPNGISFHRFDGSLQSRFGSDEPKGTPIIMSGSKAVFDVTVNGKPKVLYRNTAVLGDYPGEEEIFLKDFKAAMLFDLEEKTTTSHIPLSEDSEYWNRGIFYEPLRLINRMDVQDDQLFIVFSKDPFIYRYQIKEDEFKLIETIHLDEEIKYLYTKENYSSKLSGESSVTNVAVVGDKVWVQYNPGLRIDLQQERQSVVEGNRISIKPASNVPKSQFSIFKNGERVKNKVMPEPLGSYSLKKDEYLWFKATANPDLEEDFSTWYKVTILDEYASIQ